MKKDNLRITFFQTNEGCYGFDLLLWDVKAERNISIYYSVIKISTYYTIFISLILKQQWLWAAGIWCT